MAHDGSMTMTDSPVLGDLLTLTGAAIAPLEALLDTAKTKVRDRVSDGARVSGALIEAEQTATHGLAWLATYVEALRQMQGWAVRLDADGKFGETEALILQITFGEYLWQVYGGLPMSQTEILRPQDIGLSQDDQRAMMAPAGMTLTQDGNTQAARLRLVELMRAQAGSATVGNSGLDEEFEMIRAQFVRFVRARVLPDAHEWPLKD